MRDQRFEYFISKFCQWSHENNRLPKKHGKKLSPALKRCIYELFRNNQFGFHFSVLELMNSDSLQIGLNIDRFKVIPSENGLLRVGIVTPNWSQGLHSHLKQEEIYDIISWFFHFAEQYIKRSMLVELMGAISLVYDRPTNFYSNSSQRLSFGDKFGISKEDVISRFYSELLNKDINISSNRQKRVLLVTELINGLDPYIHRIIFNYIRAQELKNAGFPEESVTSLDKTINVVEQFLKERFAKAKDDDKRSSLGKYLNLNSYETVVLEHIYQLRCYFGGHPAFSKWWDFSELYPETEDEYFEVVKKIVLKCIFLEQNNRVVSKKPNDWLDWLGDNWKIVWDSAWFDKIP